MAFTTLSEDFVFDLVQSEDQFPVDFDQAWQWIGYAKKQNAKDKLAKNFNKGVDWVFTHMRVNSAEQGVQGGRPVEQIWLSVDCFKCLAMMAGTAKGKEVRQYFLDCERRLKELARQPKTQPQPTKSLERQLYEFFEEWKAAQLFYRGPLKPNGKKRTETDLRMHFFVLLMNRSLALPTALNAVALMPLTFQRFCRIIADQQNELTVIIKVPLGDLRQGGIAQYRVTRNA